MSTTPDNPTPDISMSGAIREALTKLLREHDEVFLIGEDIGVYGGAFKITRGIVEEFGDRRIIDTPISEAGIVSVAAGAALMGSRPIIEIMFMDFMALAFDGIINIAAKWQETYGDDFAIPMIIRAPAGGGRNYGPTHSQSFEGLLMNVPNLVICCPSCPADAAGLLLGAFEARTTVVVVEHKTLYARKGPVPEPLAPLPIGQGIRRRNGEDISLIAYGRHVPAALAAAETLAAEGISADVIDLRTVKPLDVDLICDSLSTTGRGISIEESPIIGGVGAEISAVVMANAFEYLEAPFARLGAAEQIIPCSPDLEPACFPSPDSIAAQARHLMAY
jgi:pyruvate/2-oxoglutarate/acetoin dehydrogenase E1 component